MSGFTRLTRKRGILHFAALLVAMRAVVRPVLRANGERSVPLWTYVGSGVGLRLPRT